MVSLVEAKRESCLCGFGYTADSCPSPKARGNPKGSPSATPAGSLRVACTPPCASDIEPLRGTAASLVATPSEAPSLKAATCVAPKASEPIPTLSLSKTRFGKVQRTGVSAGEMVEALVLLPASSPRSDAQRQTDQEEEDAIKLSPRRSPSCSPNRGKPLRVSSPLGAMHGVFVTSDTTPAWNPWLRSVGTLLTGVLIGVVGSWLLVGCRYCTPGGGRNLSPLEGLLGE
jgi:hypothetical protein